MTPLINRLLHYTAYVVGFVVIAVCAVALYLRLVIMPNIDHYKGDIETLAGHAVGVPVRLGAIEADWWGLNPRFSLRQVEFAHPKRRAPLILSRVDTTLSWLSLFTLDIRLTNLALYNPELEIRRDKDGMVYVADIPINRPGPPSPFPDWLLRQRYVMVSDGRLIWNDAQLDAPPLVLNHVNLVLRNRLGEHMLGVTAHPPEDSVQALDVRADLYGSSIHQWDEWRGKVYARADGASAVALLRWAPWAQDQLRAGIGDVRFWLNLDRGRIQGLTGDVRLSHVALSLSDDRPEMRFKTISGRLGWTRNQDQHTFFADKLHFNAGEGRTAEPANFRIQSRQDRAGKLVLTGARADHLRIEALTALSGAIPMPREYHDLIEKLRPRGYVDHVEFAGENLQTYKLAANFREAGIQATGALPGISGLNGRIRATGTGGEAEFDSKGLELNIDKVFRQPLALNHFATKLAWEKTAENGTHLSVLDAQFGNTDLEGTAKAQFNLQPKRATWVDIDAHLSRGNGNAVWRYIPRQVSDKTEQWLKHSIVSGTSPDTRLILKGPLDQFPYDKGGGEFYVAVKVKDARLEYASDWPAIDGISGDLLFKGVGMHISATSAKILGVNTAPVTAVIPDFNAEQEMLHVDGQARGSTTAFLNFIQKSPVHDHTGRFTERIRAEGQGQLKLQIHLPLRNLEDSRVSGEYRLIENTITPGKDLPTLTNVSGNLGFTESKLKGEGISAKLFGQPAKLDISSEQGGQVRLGLNGQVNAVALREWQPKWLEGKISGSTPYQATVNLKSRHTAIQLQSDLAGITVRLPSPLNKGPDQAIPLTISTSDSGDSNGIFNVNYGKILTMKLVTGADQEPHIGLHFGTGTEPSLPRNPGIRITGTLRHLDLDAWQNMTRSNESGVKAGPTLQDMNLTISQLRILNRVLHDTNIKAVPMKRGWELDIKGQEIIGNVLYAEAGGLPGKRLVGHFYKLALPSEEPGPKSPAETDPAELPRIVEINTQSFSLGNLDIGQLNTYMEAERTGLRTRNLTISNPDGHLEGSGWISASHRQATELDVKLDSAHVGNLLARLGITEGLKNGDGSLTGRIHWLGRPEDFVLASLGGKLNIKMKSGRFSKLDPGAGRLLGILSLQALPRRIVLDFRDVFSEGFAFDSIEGDVHIERGVAYLPNLVIKGPAATVQMKGKIDLDKETQELRVTIQPRLDDSLAVAGAILGGPVVGVGTFVATKILQNPMSKAATYEYLITGGWAEPIVTKMSRPSPNADATP